MNILPTTLLICLFSITANAQGYVITYDSRESEKPDVAPLQLVDIGNPDPTSNPRFDSRFRGVRAPALFDRERMVGITITGTVEQAKTDLQAAIASIPPTPLEMLTRKLATQIVLQEDLTEEDISWLVELNPPWIPGISVATGQVYTYEGQMYRVVQAHTTQSDWKPKNVPALFTSIQPAGVIAPWKQPAGAHDAYKIGDRVTYKGATWESTAANNVWAPGVYGWVQI